MSSLGFFLFYAFSVAPELVHNKHFWSAKSCQNRRTLTEKKQSYAFLALIRFTSRFLYQNNYSSFLGGRMLIFNEKDKAGRFYEDIVSFLNTYTVNANQLTTY